MALNEICGRSVTFQETKKAFREGFSHIFSEGFSRGDLTTFESELRKKLLDEVRLNPVSTVSSNRFFS